MFGNKRLEAKIAALDTELATTRAVLTALERSTAVIELSLDGQVLAVNDNFCNTVGYSALDRSASRIGCCAPRISPPAAITQPSGIVCAVANFSAAPSSAGTRAAATSGWKPPTTRCSTLTIGCTKWSSSPR